MSPHEVFTRIFPVWTYARLPSLAAVALGVHLVGCKPVVVAGALCSCATVAVTLSSAHRGGGWCKLHSVEPTA